MLSINKKQKRPHTDITVITELDLSNNKLCVFQIDIYLHINLITLNLSYNKLTILPSDIGRLIYLTELNLTLHQKNAITIKQF